LAHAISMVKLRKTKSEIIQRHPDETKGMIRSASQRPPMTLLQEMQQQIATRKSSIPPPPPMPF